MRRYSGLGLFVWLCACGSAVELPVAADVGSVLPVASPETPLEAPLEAWGGNDNPSRLDGPLEYKLGHLPLQGAVRQMPWVGSYWPTYLDSINYTWAGTGSESAAHKYGRAFGVDNVEAQVSRFHGIDSRAATPCYSSGPCGLGKMCGFRPGRSVGSCMPLWWGICHAWAAASLLHPEPRHPVVYNGVSFSINDIKALLTLVYNTSEDSLISLRCELEKNQIGYDRSKRPYDLPCRDTNPGTFHLILSNFVGLQHRSFVEDRSMDKDVWNQPIRSYKVLQMKEISAHKANRVLGVRKVGDAYAYNPRAAHLVFVKTQMFYLREATPQTDGYLGVKIDNYTFSDTYDYVLELDRHGAIIGGEWAQDSKKNHPDFLWLPLRPNSTAVAGGAIRTSHVMELVAMSY